MLTSSQINVSFNLDTGKFVFTDVTDYTAQGVLLSDITGVIKVTAPSGIVYSGGSPDIDGSVSRTNTTTILIPLTGSGVPEKGLYTFEYTATDGVDTVVYKVNYTYSYTAPTVTIEATADCVSPELVSTDTTSYMSGTTTPSTMFSIVDADEIANTFTIAGEKMGLLTAGDTFNIINSTANDGEYTVVSIAYNGTNTVISVANVPDGTDDGTLVTKTNTIYYPQVLGLSPLVGYTTINSTNVFYTETQEFKVVTKSFYDFGNGISVVDTTSGTAELKVDCDVRLCEVYCCIDSVLKAYLNQRGVNDVLSKRYLEKYILATSHLSALRNAFECGKNNDVNTLVSEIFRVTECNPDCSCSDGTPTPITGVGAANITEVQSSGNGILVGSTTVGNRTTYTLSLSQSILDQIAAATATSVVTSTDLSIDVVANTVGSVTTYDLSIPSSTPIVAPKELYSFEVLLEFTPGSLSQPTVTIQNETFQNQDNLQTPTFTFLNTATSIYNPFSFKLENFQVSNNDTYKVYMNVVDTVEHTPNGNLLSYQQKGYKLIPITSTASGEIFGGFQSTSYFSSANKMANYGILQNFTTIKLNVLIIE